MYGQLNILNRKKKEMELNFKSKMKQLSHQFPKNCFPYVQKNLIMVNIFKN